MTKHSDRKAKSVSASPFVALAAGNGSILEAMARSVETCMKAGLLYQDDLFRFAASRLEWDSKICRALLACKTRAEIVEIQRDWASSTAQDYLEEVSHLIQLTSKFAMRWMTLPGQGAAPAKEIEVSHRA